MNALKKVVASVAACATLGTMAVSASAAIDKSHKFDFDLGSYSNDFTDYVTKKDGFESDAVVTPENGDASASKPIYVTVYYIKRLGNVYRVSSTNRLKSNSDKVYISYTDEELVKTGSSYSLLGETGAYSAKASGYWNP